jgi:hypothetical protein
MIAEAAARLLEQLNRRLGYAQREPAELAAAGPVEGAHRPAPSARFPPG